MSKYINSEGLFAYLEEVGDCYPRYADLVVDNAVNEVVGGIKTFITSHQQELEEENLDAEIAIYLNKNVLNRINNSDIIEDFTTMEAGDLARHFYELGRNAGMEAQHLTPEEKMNHPLYLEGFDVGKKVGEVLKEPKQPACKTCGFYENNCPFIRGKLIPYPSKVCKDYTKREVGL